MLEKLTRTRWWKYLRRFKYPPELKYPPKCAYPTEFDNVPAARAWLYSRVKATPVQFFPSENESRLPVHNRNERSRPLHDPNKLLEPGHVREWTFQNLIAAGHILWYLFLKITNLFQSEMRLRTTIYLVHQLLCCAESGFSIWGEGHVMSLIERSLLRDERALPQGAVFIASAAIFSVIKGPVSELLKNNDMVVDNYLSSLVERKYLSCEMMEPLSGMVHQVRVDMRNEAAVIGKAEQIKDPEARLGRLGTDVSVLHHVEPMVHLLRSVIGICSYIALVCHTSPCRLGVTLLVLVAKLCIPVICPPIGVWFINHFSLSWPGNQGGYDPFREEIQRIRNRVEREKEDIRLYGLNEWLLEAWTEARRQLQRDTTLERRAILNHDQLELFFHVGLDLLVTSQSIDSTFSFGRFAIHYACLTRLTSSLLSLATDIDAARHSTYWFGAFVALIECQSMDDKGKVDYGAYRGGMRMEAINVSVSNPEKPKPIVDDVSLTIESGDTIAIVGVPFSGKTSLAKALMGLRHHTGTIKINEKPLRSYQRSSLHKRMTGSFKDCPKYGLSIGTDLGVGQVDRSITSTDDPRFKRALQLAGSEGLMEKIKLDTLLCDNKEHSFEKDFTRRDDCDRVHLRMPRRNGINLTRAFMRLGSADLIVIDVTKRPAGGNDVDFLKSIYVETHKPETRATTIIVASTLTRIPMVDKVAWMNHGVLEAYDTYDVLMKLPEFKKAFDLYQGHGYTTWFPRTKFGTSNASSTVDAASGGEGSASGSASSAIPAHTRTVMRGASTLPVDTSLESNPTSAQVEAGPVRRSGQSVDVVVQSRGDPPTVYDSPDMHVVDEPELLDDGDAGVLSRPLNLSAGHAHRRPMQYGSAISASEPRSGEGIGGQSSRGVGAGDAGVAQGHGGSHIAQVPDQDAGTHGSGDGQDVGVQVIEPGWEGKEEWSSVT